MPSPEQERPGCLGGALFAFRTLLSDLRSHVQPWLFGATIGTATGLALSVVIVRPHWNEPTGPHPAVVPTLVASIAIGAVLAHLHARRGAPREVST